MNADVRVRLIPDTSELTKISSVHGGSSQKRYEDQLKQQKVFHEQQTKQFQILNTNLSNITVKRVALEQKAHEQGFKKLEAEYRSHTLRVVDLTTKLGNQRINHASKIATQETQLELKKEREITAIWRKEYQSRDEVKRKGQGAGMGILGVGRELFGSSTVGTIAAGAVAGFGIAQVVSSLKEFAKVGIEAIERTEQITVGFRATGQSAREAAMSTHNILPVILQISNALGVNNHQVQEATARYLQFGGTADKLSEKIPIIIALAQRTGRSLEEASRFLVKGTDPELLLQLTRMGIKFDEGATAEERFAKVAEKVQPLLEGMKEKAKGLSGQLNTATNNWQSLEDNIGEFIAHAGAPLVSILNDLFGGLNKIANAQNQYAAAVEKGIIPQETFGTKLEKLFDVLTGNHEGLLRLNEDHRREIDAAAQAAHSVDIHANAMENDAAKTREAHIAIEDYLASLDTDRQYLEKLRAQAARIRVKNKSGDVTEGTTQTAEAFESEAKKVAARIKAYNVQYSKEAGLTPTDAETTSSGSEHKGYELEKAKIDGGHKAKLESITLITDDERVVIEAKRILNEAYQKDLYTLAIHWREKRDAAELESIVQLNEKKKGLVIPITEFMSQEQSAQRSKNTIGGNRSNLLDRYGKRKATPEEATEAFYQQFPFLRPQTVDEALANAEKEFGKFTGILSDSFNQAFDNINRGFFDPVKQKLREVLGAFGGDFVSGILQGMARLAQGMAARAATFGLLSALTGGDAFKGKDGSKMSIWDYILGKGAASFGDGGFTGDGNDNEVAGLVHKNEFVITRAMVQSLGAHPPIEMPIEGTTASPDAQRANRKINKKYYNDEAPINLGNIDNTITIGIAKGLSEAFGGGEGGDQLISGFANKYKSVTSTGSDALDRIGGTTGQVAVVAGELALMGDALHPVIEGLKELHPVLGIAGEVAHHGKGIAATGGAIAAAVSANEARGETSSDKSSAQAEQTGKTIALTLINTAGTAKKQGGLTAGQGIGAIGGILSAIPGFGIFGGILGALGGLFDEGGYTGAGGVHQPKGIVHGGEYVFSQSAVNRIGVHNLDNLHSSLKGYASGGFVGSDRMFSPRISPIILDTRGVILSANREYANRELRSFG